MSRPIGRAGLAMIQKWEGCRLTAYKPVPTEEFWTIGWGHYGPDVKEGDVITQEEADALLVADCQRFADAVDNPANVALQLNDNQRDALISFAYNCGEGNLRTLCKGRTHEEVREAILLYNKSNGKTLQGLVNRRLDEQKLFDTPVIEKKDNAPAAYAEKAVDWAVANGILQGDTTGDLKLTEPCTRQQMVTFLYRFAKQIGEA